MEIEKVAKSDTSIAQHYSTEEVDEHYRALDRAVRAYKKSFIDIGLNLYWLDEVGDCCSSFVNGVYCRNVADFALEKYGISRATTYQYIAIIRKFGRINPKNGFIDKLDDKYRDYNSTALMVMSGMDDDQLSQCKPDMKIKELKALRDKKALEDRAADSGHKKSASQEKKDSSGQGSRNTNSAKLYTITDAADFDSRKKEITESIKKALSQGNGKQYHIDIIMTWDD